MWTPFFYFIRFLSRGSGSSYKTFLSFCSRTKGFEQTQKKKGSFIMSPHEMKEEIETTHFEHTFAVLGTNRAAEATPHPKGRGVCVSPQPLPWVLSCDECLSFYYLQINKNGTLTRAPGGADIDVSLTQGLYTPPDIDRSPTGHRQVTDRSPTGHRQVTDRSPTGHRQVTDRSPTGHRQVTDRSPTGHRQVTDRSPTGHRQVTDRS